MAAEYRRTRLANVRSGRVAAGNPGLNPKVEFETWASVPERCFAESSGIRRGQTAGCCQKMRWSEAQVSNSYFRIQVRIAGRRHDLNEHLPGEFVCILPPWQIACPRNGRHK